MSEIDGSETILIVGHDEDAEGPADVPGSIDEDEWEFVDDDPVWLPQAEGFYRAVLRSD